MSVMGIQAALDRELGERCYSWCKPPGNPDYSRFTRKVRFRRPGAQGGKREGGRLLRVEG